MNAFCRLLILAAIVFGFFLESGMAMSVTMPQVQIGQGLVEVLGVGGVREFLGIPYAMPPVGNLRWRPPVAAHQWKGVLQATKFGPACAQITTLGVFAGPSNDSEDCLTLKVFVPSIKTSKKLSVLVWIHGGGNFDGSSSGYDRSRLVTLGKIVVVTVNYRLGLLGWPANPALDAEGHPFGNYGLGPAGIAHRLNAQQQRLSDAMVRAWANFARSGNPNGSGVSNWPLLKQTANRPGLYLYEAIPTSRTITDQEFSSLHKCNFWADAQGFGIVYDLPH